MAGRRQKAEEGTAKRWKREIKAAFALEKGLETLYSSSGHSESSLQLHEFPGFVYAEGFGIGQQHAVCTSETCLYIRDKGLNAGSFRGIQPYGFSGPYWKMNCLGLHIKYSGVSTVA